MSNFVEIRLLSVDEQEPVDYDEAVDQIKRLRNEVELLREALKALLKRDYRNTCMHEETHRGGTVLIPSFEGAFLGRWADDNGGFPGAPNPPEWKQAEEALAATEGEK